MHFNYLIKPADEEFFRSLFGKRIQKDSISKIVFGKKDDKPNEIKF